MMKTLCKQSLSPRTTHWLESMLLAFEGEADEADDDESDVEEDGEDDADHPPMD